MVSFAVGAITATVSVTGLLDHHVLASLERQPGELEYHDAWRPATSPVVHDDWLALASNLVLLAVVGIAPERRLSRVEWLTLYLCAGLTGQLVGVAWQPHGAGNSVASLTARWRSRRRRPAGAVCASVGARLRGRGAGPVDGARRRWDDRRGSS
jgi:rhomboid protease GluP